MKKELLIMISCLFANSLFGQPFTDLYGDYLGLTPPGDTPVIFAPGIISGNSLEHSPAIFSPDGNEVYWVSREDQSNSGKINLWVMTRINNRWTKPVNFAPFGECVNWMDPFLSNDGKRLYFSTERAENRDIWFIERQNNAWSKPQCLCSTINTTSGQNQASVTSDGTLYFIDYKWTSKNWTCDILRSKLKNGDYLQPEKLPTSINSTSEDWTPYIAKDDSYLIFSSLRRSEYGDLFISFHDIPSDTWSEPISMGDSINTSSQETFPTVSPDGKYLFFTRYTDEKNDMDVYWVSAKIIDRLREKIK